LQVAVTHWDEYFKALDAGHAPSAPDNTWASFPYHLTEDVRTTDGSFDAVFDLSGWPKGNAGAIVTFSLGLDQPAEALARFGSRGERLDGKGVVQDF
jgi:hypothetical protein